MKVALTIGHVLLVAAPAAWLLLQVPPVLALVLGLAFIAVSVGWLSEVWRS